MLVQTGFTIAFNTFGPTPMNLLLNVRPERRADLVTPEVIAFDPPVPATQHVDAFGNVCTRIVAPGGRITMSADFTIGDSGEPDAFAPQARQHQVQDLPDDVLPFLLGSRYCDTDKLSATAWSLFGATPEGWARVQAIVDFVHNHLRFDYQLADNTRTAHDGYVQRVGVCRDFAHLAIALCRCMNIPARYATGYLGDIGVPKDPAPMDFSAWFEIYLGDRWYTFDARHNTPRIARIVMARGRDATDCALTTSFGTAYLMQFDVHTDEVSPDAGAMAEAA
ncbi:transglutaminase family protein [Methylobacterium sp. WL30]|uniref:transglutaminase-like domain-containing protein n=1 Tax=unclassified Methylobacterium TaxID=2615210 RepID=UPI0011C81239|nr:MULTISPECIES: transglutaminase family protein [unclassified Methylobacterium]TXM92406.1 transglutaminase family protein [Methylobacterium sp. WL116]TXN33335.1 transglutaminase family protein [Methylobacterium sp. WL93]TXN47840.1 transglutaminase family protein [Methylobacterium sp. WL119]TXN67577.1 transglutaminase family protein [Methylobacterium sp. WL30]